MTTSNPSCRAIVLVLSRESSLMRMIGSINPCFAKARRTSLTMSARISASFLVGSTRQIFHRVGSDGILKSILSELSIAAR
jgi:hypothetical protein